MKIKQKPTAEFLLGIRLTLQFEYILPFWFHRLSAGLPPSDSHISLFLIILLTDDHHVKSWTRQLDKGSLKFPVPSIQKFFFK